MSITCGGQPVAYELVSRIAPDYFYNKGETFVYQFTMPTGSTKVDVTFATNKFESYGLAVRWVVSSTEGTGTAKYSITKQTSSGESVTIADNISSAASDSYVYFDDVPLNIGDEVILTVTPDVGTELYYVGWNGAEIVANEDGSYSFTVPSGTISSKMPYQYFTIGIRKQKPVTITDQSTGGGTVTNNSTEVDSSLTVAGGQLICYPVPNEGYYMKSFSYSTDGTTYTSVGLSTSYEGGFVCSIGSATTVYYKAEFELLSTLAASETSFGYSEENKAITISDAAGMQRLAEIVNNGQPLFGAKFMLTDNIDLSGIVWTPIGADANIHVASNPTGGASFQGSFDGNQKTISGLSITDTTVHNFVGLFGCSDYGYIKNLTVEGSIHLTKNNGGNETNGISVGGVAGYAHDVSACVNKVNITLDHQVMYAGGIAGCVDEVSDCTNLGDINFTSASISEIVYYHGDFGGIAGHLMTSAVNCGNYGNITLKANRRYTGSSNNVVQTEYDVVLARVGGIAGSVEGNSSSPKLNPVSISDCLNKGDITGHFQKAGGIVGYGDGGILNITNCYNIGAIIQNAQGAGDGGFTATIRLGGIAGCTNLMSQDTSLNLGGELNIANCYSTITPVCDNSSYKYKAIGTIEANSATDSYNGRGTTTVVNSLGGSALTQAFLVGLTSLSAYEANGTYPKLSWETDDTGSYALTITVSTATEKNYTLSLYSDAALTQQVGETMTGASGTSVSVASIPAGEYYYRVSADGCHTETGSVTVFMRDKAVSLELKSGTKVTLRVTPASTNFAVTNSGAAVAYSCKTTSGNTAVYVYDLYTDGLYAYDASASGYASTSCEFTPSDASNITVSLETGKQQSTNTTVTIVPGQNVHITKGGSYDLTPGTYGSKSVIYIDTGEAVTLTGAGVSTADQCQNLYIKCTVAKANLTLQDVYISNSGTDSATNLNLIDFTGSSNKLTFAGTNILEEDTNATGKALIHVGNSTSLTISGGTAYIYKYEQGSGIGGDMGEANGTINITDATLFIKGSKQGALIGSGASAANQYPGDITISGSELNLIAVARGAAIGSGAGTQDSVGPDVTIKNSTVNINVNYSGAAIGGGGYDQYPYNDTDGGRLTVVNSSIRTYIDENAVGYWGAKGVTSVGVNDNAAITATINGGKSKLVVVQIEDPNAADTFTVYGVKDGKETQIYSGGLHRYSYINEGRSKDNELGVSYTISNWKSGGDSNLYLYLTEEYDEYVVKANNKVVESTVVSGGGGSTTATPVVETPVNQTEVTTETKVDGTAATVTADSAALAEAAKTADANTQFVISSDVGDADVSQVTANVEKDSVKAVAEAQASVKVETPVANITLPNEALKDIAAQSGATVSVTAELKADGSTTINLSVDSKSMTKLSGGIKAAIPVILDKISKGINRTTISDSKVPLGETPDSTESTETDTTESTTDSAVSVDMNGLVAVLVSDDGTESIIPKSVIEDSTVYVLLDGSATVKVADNSKTFTDVADTWYTDAVSFAAGHELFNGVSDSEFAPLNKMSRAMLVTVLHRLEGTPSSTNAASFSDVESGKWYTDAISWANANDIVNGLGDGLFGTNNNITREQMATILYRYNNEQGMSVSASGDISGFPDGDSVSSYAEEAMSWAIGSGIITGKDSAEGTILDPKGNASRAEVATMLKRMVGIMVK
jgi:hypothetical protein